MKKIMTAVTIAAVMAGGTAYAQDFEAQLKARQGQFRILAINLGILGGMAKGAVEYNADAATAAANSIAAVSMINQAPLWPAGSDSMSIDGTRAMPAMWDNLPDVMAKWGAVGVAAAEMQTAAATGPEAIGPALGKLGGTCKACHDAYREPQ